MAKQRERGRYRGFSAERRQQIVQRFGLEIWRARCEDKLPGEFIDQLVACVDDPSRRLLLGKSERGETGHMPDPISLQILATYQKALLRKLAARNGMEG